MIITTAEVKALLQITDTSQDTLIDTLIPIVQDQIVQYCHNSFTKKNYGIKGAVFVYGAPDTITADFTDIPFIAGDIYVVNSDNNDGYYTIDTKSDTTLTLSSSNTLSNETSTDAVISPVVWPEGIKLSAANMIGFNLEKLGWIGSESMGEYSVSYVDIGGESYPSSITGTLKMWRGLFW